MSVPAVRGRPGHLIEEGVPWPHVWQGASWLKYAAYTFASAHIGALCRLGQGCPNGRNSHFFANQKSIFANEIFAKKIGQLVGQLGFATGSSSFATEKKNLDTPVEGQAIFRQGEGLSLYTIYVWTHALYHIHA